MEKYKKVDVRLTYAVTRYIEQVKSKEQLATIHDMIMERAAWYRSIKEEHGSLVAIQSVFREIEAALRKDENLHLVSCKKGCCFCCHTNVDITRDEAEMLIAYADHTGFSIDRDYLMRQAQVDPKEHAVSPESACVFLKDRLCQVYEMRPVACRKYFVATPPDNCNVGNGRNLNVHFLFDLKVEMMACATLQDAGSDSMAKQLLAVLEEGKPVSATSCG